MRNAVVLFLICTLPARGDDAAFFESKIRPVLVEHCLKCHGGTPGKEPKGGLKLDSRAALLQGGDSGPALLPGEPAKSRIIEAIRYGNADLVMPPAGKLPDAVIQDFEKWVKAGAVWPGSESANSSAKKAFDLVARRKEHWAWRPLEKTSPPVGPGTRIDRYLHAKRDGVAVNPPADPATLLRRLSFDLTGLPPSLAEQEELQKHPERYADMVDRYLASPQYAEHWARHWLDLVRYADTKGHEFDHTIPNAWRYRDYVIRAFDADLPYRQFVTEHLAGDRLAPPRRHADGSNESVQGTGFWLLGEEIHSPVDIRLDQADRLDNRIDVFGKAFLGMTIACARCHDHKFDAISTADYYALFTLLESSPARLARIDDSQSTMRKLGVWSTDSPVYRFENGITVYDPALDTQAEKDSEREPGALNPHRRAGRILHSRVERIGHGQFHILINGPAVVYAAVSQHQLVSGPLHAPLVRTYKPKGWRWEQIDLSAYRGLPVHFEISPVNDQPFAIADFVTGEKPPPRELPSFELPQTVDVKKSSHSRLALALAELNSLDGHVFIRGQTKNLGETVSPRNLQALGGKPFAEGRMSLAEQLTDPNLSPLTYRVFANRIWRHLFGRGLVTSVDNFGVLGEAPTHPELLDDLANRLIDTTPKKLIREIVLSDAYRMSSADRPDLTAKDPKNTRYCRQELRRLEAESIRDAILAISGRLDRTRFGPAIPTAISPFQDGRGKPASGPMDGHGRRSIYLRVSRNFLSPFALAFDQPTPLSTVGQRTTSNVPAQALILLNDEFVRSEAKRWGEAVSRTQGNAAFRIDLMYRGAFNRPPTDAERTACLKFLGDSPDWPALAHVLLNVKEFVLKP